MPSDPPSHHKALVIEAVGADLQVQTLPTPQADTGSVVVRVIAAGVLSYQREIYGGQRTYAFPMPLVGGFSAIARVAAVGPDATLLKPGQLVFVDCVIRARDDPSARYLTAIHEGGSEGSKKLMKDVWRNGTFAEYAKAPLDNCIPLDEARLCHELGYTPQDLMYLCYLLVPFGGLRDIKVEPGETVVVCPATGGFGGAGVQVAVAMGARVIAMGRNEKELARLKEHVKKGTPWASVETVKITGDETRDTAALQAFGTIDAVLDLSPPAAMNSTHLKSAILALRQGGRCSLMGLASDFVPVWKVISDDIVMKGKLMYSRDDMLLFVKMLERGLFPKGESFVDAKTFALEDWKEAFDEAAEYIGIGKHVMITP
ncbi:chaperonin 10-like protein [Exophiala viscosa]|uniref:chaperonin 10-like protein n=1 Tax=Exophiala viscosa TaxID=2486360 RepID=UPI002196B256|nr:chaperonin 10-like protein [Exophiala viscosa]